MRTVSRRNLKSSPAGIEYVGLPGISKECQDAVLRMLQYGDRITKARILSSPSDHCKNHCLLLTVNVGDLVAVKSGFASGYGGEGPHTFSYVLQILESHGAEIEEYAVAPDVLERVDSSSLTATDLNTLDAAKPVHPRRWHDYVLEEHWEQARDATLWRLEFPLVIPFAVIDSRIMDLALSFWDGPDGKLLTGYRRLEDIVRQRTAIDEHGAKLFSQAFDPNAGKLAWKDMNTGEHVGRMTLFTGAYIAYRNRRAHRESKDHAENLLAEFLLLNHLYRLEQEAMPRTRRLARKKQKTTSP